MSSQPITIRGARQNNLRRVDLDLPAGALIAVTGVSGSGKSSLAHDVIHAEGQRRYLEVLSSHTRQYLLKLDRPELDHAGGLRPAVAVDQRTAAVPGAASARSTVGTLTGLGPQLRLLLSRLGPTDGRPLPSSLFSFNSPVGQCPACRGLGVEDRVDPELLVGDPALTLRQGALVVTTPAGYMVYSQITMDSLDLVCRAHGFDVDTPWQRLTDEQRGIIFFGSDLLKVPLGKHKLESRLRWSGITARPREEGYYRGIVPIIQGILRVKRNKNALRFARSQPCSACGGARLRPEALEVRLRGLNMADLSDLSVAGLERFAAGMELTTREAPVGAPLLEEVSRRCALLRRLGVGHLQLHRGAATLAGGEARRVRLATQLQGGLQGLLHVLDEPTVGLHPRDIVGLLRVLHDLRDQGGSVLVVEHDPATILAADWIVDVGPGAGKHGGQIQFSGPVAEFLADAPPDGAGQSLTRAHLRGEGRVSRPPGETRTTGELVLRGAAARNLAELDVTVKLGAFNVVCGVSGSGKSTLVGEVLGPAVARALGKRGWRDPGTHRSLEGAGALKRVLHVDQRPIGRTPRSNAATYTGLHDHLRAGLARTDAARERGWGKGRFSFNVKGGRCEACQGAGVQSVGMHYLADVEVRCPQCAGRRFNSETLEVQLHGHSVADLLELPVARALELFDGASLVDKACRGTPDTARCTSTALFSGKSPARRILRALDAVGLGYLPLGQPATTLSGGEAQRVKLAAELGRAGKGLTLFLLDEPTTGLHPADVQVLLNALSVMVEQGHTVVVVEHDLDVIAAADHVIDLGPEGGAGGGRLLAQGSPEEITRTPGSPTAEALGQRGSMENRASREFGARPQRGGAERKNKAGRIPAASSLNISGARTHNLRGLSLRIPHETITALVGVSGSGKSSLALDTIAAEAHHRYASALSAFARQFMRRAPRGEVDNLAGLTPVVTVAGEPGAGARRSTLATYTGVYDDLRLILSRAGQPKLAARDFSFNHSQGACLACEGLGSLPRCDPALLVTHGDRSLLDGALSGHSPGAHYGDPDDRYVAILQEVGRHHGVDFSRPWSELSGEARELAMRGTGEQIYQVSWRYNRAGRTGTHELETTWLGFAALIEEDYAIKRGQRRGAALEALIRQVPCTACAGRRLSSAPLAVRLPGLELGISDLSAATVTRAQDMLRDDRWPEREGKITAEPRQRVLRRLRALEELGIGHLQLNRPLATLSRGEARRAQLAGALGLGLCGLTYVLDEPTVGLHPSDTARLIQTLRRLRDRGNTVLVVEHDPELILAADRVVELGPGAGEAGGELLFEGAVGELLSGPDTSTARQLRQHQDETAAATLSSVQLQEGIRLRGASANNLRDLDLHLPRGGLGVITGVSGAGKSTLLNQVLLPSAALGQPVGCAGVEGLGRFRHVTALHRHPARRGGAGNPATRSGAMDAIRKAFAGTALARQRGFPRSSFAPGGKGGRCQACKGAGQSRVEMGFLADVRLPCHACGGTGYNHELLEVEVGGLNLAQVMALTVDRAVLHFGEGSPVARRLSPLARAGLGYMRLGQPARTLSSGELQRLGLAALLDPAETEPADPGDLLLLDEPTVGLHMQDVAALLRLQQQLIAAGHTLLLVEHHPMVIAAAHWQLELGPGSGAKGGRIVQQTRI